MVSPRRRFGSERIVILVGFSALALALAPLRADAQPSYWPVRKAVPSSGVGNVEIYPDSAATTSEDLIFNADEGTQIVADGAVVASDLLVIGHTVGISARIKVLEEKLAEVRTNYNAISLDDLTAADDHCKINVAQLKTDVSDLEAQVAKSPNVVIPPECDGTYVAGLRREEISGVNQWTCACKYEYSGDNCVTPSCDLSTFGYDTTAAAVVSSTCGLNEGYLKAGDSCEYSCADGYMPNTFTATNTARRIDCEKVDSTTVTTKAGTPATPANITVDANSALTCVTCDSTGFTNYTGNNCQTPSCLVNTVLSDTNNVIDSTCGTSMKADGTCTYSCDNSMPTGLTNTGQSRTLTCSTGGTTITATGFTGSAASACSACSNEYSGINCELNSCDISTLKNDINFANINCPDDAYVAAGGSCTYDCADGFMPINAAQTGQSGTISCAITGAVSGDDGITPSGTAACQSCAAFGVPDNTGVNCATAPTQGGGGAS